MSFFSRLLGTAPDPMEELRPLWHAVVAEARNPVWYRECGAADTVEGRFDMITNITAMAMLRLESEPDLIPASARLTELFAEDMEGQLRETGLGDPTLGKKMGKLMEAMGGRLGAYRESIPQGLDATAKVVARNANLLEGHDQKPMAERLIALNTQLAQISREDLLAGKLAAQ